MQVRVGDGSFADDARRGSIRYDAGRDIVDHNRARTDDRVIAYGHSVDNCDAQADSRTNSEVNVSPGSRSCAKG